MSGKLRVNVHFTPSDLLKTEQNISLNVKEDISWSDACTLIKEKLCLSLTESLAFQYLDDVADYISGCTEEEWKDAISFGSTQSRDEQILHINAVPTQNVGAQKANCISNSVCSPGSASWCCFERPMPENPEDDGVIPEKIVNPQSSTYKYANEALRAVTLPLGPIGGGSIALAGDGGLRQWQVINAVCHLAHVPDSFFAIKVQNGSASPKSAVLQSNTWYNQDKFKPANLITDHVVPDASKVLLDELPGVKTIEVTAKYPIAEVDIPRISDDVPVSVHLEAFNPCIPLNSKDSGIPIIIFNYTVTNPNPNPVTVTMLSSLMNFIGWDGKQVITSCDKFCSFGGGNMNDLYMCHGETDGGDMDEYKDVSGYCGVHMSNTLMNDKEISNGELSIGVLTKPGDVHGYLLQFTDIKTMWSSFNSDDGLAGQGQTGVSDKGKTWCGALSCKREIQSKESETFTFILSWHFPYRFTNWHQQVPINPKSLYYLGNQYSTFWPKNEEVLKYTTSNIGRLTQVTRQFRDDMFVSSLPWQLIDSAAGRLSVLRSPCFMWLGDSNLYCFEGCGPDSGCCPLNCTHVLNYEMAVAKCFPDLERTMRMIDLKHNIAPNYVVPSRTSVPLELKRQWESWNWENPSNSVDLSSTRICLDGDLGTVLKTYREIRQGASKKFFDDVWPQIKSMMERYMTSLDDGSGMIKGAQPCTYDVATYGVDTFIGCLYLCALRAAEEMAKLQNETDLGVRYANRFKLGSTNLDKYCFHNGKWYTQVVDPNHPKETLSDGTFVDALIGQWWAHSLGLGYLLPKDHIQSHLQFVFQRNHVDSFDPALQKPRKFFDQRDAGMFITSWGKEKPPAVPFLYSYEGAWTGLEHSFGGLCFYEQLNDIGLHVQTDCRQKYDGTRRSPWNEIECGDHYARPMAAFLFFEIISGMTWNIVTIGENTLNLKFAPTLSPEKFKSFFIVGSGWGSYSQTINDKSGDVELAVTYGEVVIAELGLTLSFSKAVVTVDGKKYSPTLTKVGPKITLTFPQPLTVNAGQIMKITLSA